jgi:alkylhydroperoxidase/carboxymuconolactone decarboxylase family protein YurZ
MTSDNADKLKAAKGRMGAFAKAAPSLMEGFVKVSKTASAAGRFSAAQKELIATAIAVAKGCEDCTFTTSTGRAVTAPKRPT